MGNYWRLSSPVHNWRLAWWGGARKMLNQRERAAQKIIHDLFNDLEKSKDSSFKDIQDVLMKVYQKLDDPKIEQAPLVNRLVNYISFTAVTKKLKFSSMQNEWIMELSTIGRKAGLNGVYRSDYGDKNQF